MARFIERSLVAAAVLAMGGMARADTLTVSLPSGLSNAPGSVAGWDTDKAAPGAATGAPVGFGDSSMYVSVGSNDYQTLRVYVQQLFGAATAPITVGQLTSFSFDTFGSDAYAIIYTSGSSANSSWYSGRYMALASDLSNPDWQTNSSADGSLIFYDTTAGLSNLTPTTFAAIQGLNNPNPIMFIDFKIGAGLNDIGPQTGQLDALRFTSREQTQTLDLTAVPLPAAVWSGMAMLSMLGFGVLRRKRVTA